MEREINLYTNMDIRKMYMTNEITQDRFKTLLQQRDKSRSKNNEFHQVFEMLMHVSADLMWKLINMPGKLTKEDMKEFHKSVDKVREFFNSACQKAGKCYNCMAPFISPEWTFMTIKYYENKV